MSLTFDERPSDSPLVARVWSSRSERDGSFVSIAAVHWEMVVSKYQGLTTLTVRGPETQATPLAYPAGVEWFGIDFKLGAFMPHLPPGQVMNLNDVKLPKASRRSFWLGGLAWQYPGYDNADTFVARLARQGLLVADPLVSAAAQGQASRPAAGGASPRSVQYRFLQATGLTHRAIRQIERARHAAARLQQGASIAEVVFEAGYFDQPHLTRALKRFIGQTPAQIAGTPLVGLAQAE